MKKIINAVIVEDIPLAANYLKDLLKENCPQVNVIATFHSGKDALAHLPRLEYDLLFLDIEYKDNYNAFQLLSDLDFKETHIIFITAYDEYRKKASELDAIKYLLKPIKKNELIKAVERSMQIFVGKETIVAMQKQYEDDFSFKKVVIRSNGISYFFDMNEIVYLTADGSYTNILYLSKNKINSLFSAKNLKRFESELDNSVFIRVHKKYIVNMNYANKLDKNKLELVVGETKIKIPIASNRKGDIIEDFLLF